MAEPHQIYLSMMIEIKYRMRSINDLLDECECEGDVKLSPLNLEFCFLQIRKIVELICFSSVVCDESRYKEFREFEGATDDSDHGEYESDWNARLILLKLKDITPHFIPIPLGQRTKINGVHHFDRANVNTTHNKLIDIYKKCGSFLHIPRPFGDDYLSYVRKQRNKLDTATQIVKNYYKYLKDLLWNHAAVGLEYTRGSDPLEAGNPQSVFLIDFGNLTDNEVGITVAVGE